MTTINLFQQAPEQAALATTSGGIASFALHQNIPTGAGYVTASYIVGRFIYWICADLIFKVDPRNRELRISAFVASLFAGTFAVWYGLSLAGKSIALGSFLALHASAAVVASIALIVGHIYQNVVKAA